MKTLVKNKKYTQGKFNCRNPQKYRGSYPIIYRSSLELKAFRWFDNNSNVLTWGSESVVVPYQGPDGKVHRYFVDLVCEMRRTTGEIQKFLIEIKPYRQTVPPVVTPRQSAKTKLYESYNYAVNSKKWEAARQYCENKKMQFFIITEKHINS